MVDASDAGGLEPRPGRRNHASLSRWNRPHVDDRGFRQSGLSADSNAARLVEIYTDNSGFYFPAGKRLYVTVYSNHRLDYMERGETVMVLRQRRLTDEQMEKLQVLLNAPGVLGASGLIEAKGQPAYRDYQTNVVVSIHRSGHEQSVTLRGFEPDAGRSFPDDVGRLLCYIDELRDASYNVTSGCKRPPF